MRRRHLLQSAGLASAALLPHRPGWAAAPAPATLQRDSALAAAALRRDLALLDRVYRELHPGLLRYLTPGQWQHAVRTLDAQWAARGEHRLDDAYVALSRLLAQVRCGHSYANFYNQRPEVAQALFEGHDRLPFTFAWLARRLVVTGGALPPGTEVLSVDGVPAGRILDGLMPMVRADGHNDGKRRALLSVDAREGYETFDIFHGLTTQAGDRFQLVVREPGRTPHRVELPAIDLAARRAMSPRSTAPASDAAPPWALRFDAAGHAVLAMPSWALYNSAWDWSAWLDRTLNTVIDAKASRLIVDLRRNEGGLDCGDLILARCTPRPLPVQAEERLVRYRRVPPDLNAVLDTWDTSFRDWGDRAQPVADRAGFYRLQPSGAAADTGASSIAPQGRRYTGRLVVLTSSTNSSATFRFAALVRAHRLGTLVGEVTGGNERGVNGGAFFFVRLPESGLEVDLPLIGYFPAGPLRPDAGLTPDVLVHETLDDLSTGRDRTLETASRA